MGSNFVENENWPTFIPENQKLKYISGNSDSKRKASGNINFKGAGNGNFHRYW